MHVVCFNFGFEEDRTKELVPEDAKGHFERRDSGWYPFL